MATKTGRGVITTNGTPLAILMMTGGKPHKSVEWIEQTGSRQVLKQGRAEAVVGNTIRVREHEKFDRTVYIPIERASGGLYLMRREDTHGDADDYEAEYQDMLRHSGQI